MSISTIDRMKKILREEDVQFFSDEDLQFYLDENSGDADAAIYQCLVVKAEDTSLSIGGMSLGDTSAYFRRLAARYRPNNSGILGGG